jgi:sterol desaturase/sphingolipid hydroxylase (fatty acid hydroxylase superfamily)
LESYYRLLAFSFILIIMIFWESLRPFHVLTESKKLRWTHNLLLIMLNTLLIKFLFLTSASSVALKTFEKGYGLLNLFELPLWMSILLTIILLDLAIYLQHLIFHKVSFLWRIHRMHHADLDFDVTTALRFHSLEMVLSMGIKICMVFLLGANIYGVILFEMILNGMAMFNHANISLPKKVDSLLRKLLVTPDMHRIHHSIVAEETNSNFGFNLSIWDKMFKTYIQLPSAGVKNIHIGLPIFRSSKYLKLHHMLTIPFISAKEIDKELT